MSTAAAARSPVSDPRQLARERQRRKRAGILTLRIRVDALWAAEMLSQSGFGNADDTDRQSIEQQLQQLVDALIEEARSRA